MLTNDTIFFEDIIRGNIIGEMYNQSRTDSHIESLAALSVEIIFRMELLVLNCLAGGQLQNIFDYILTSNQSS